MLVQDQTLFFHPALANPITRLLGGRTVTTHTQVLTEVTASPESVGPPQLNNLAFYTQLLC